MYDKQDNRRGMYAPRIEEFAALGRKAGWSPAAQDSKTKRVALVIVDMQWDFCHPTGNLSVPGSLDDLERLVEFIYSNGDQITSIYASLDSHLTYHIFYPLWWGYLDSMNGDPTGIEHPGAYTVIVLNKQGEAQDTNGRRLIPLIDPRWSMQYLHALAAGGKKSLMIWPYHTMVGTMGHALMPSLSEALAFHAAARNSQTTFIQKAEPTSTEFYSIWGAEVPDPRDPRTALNTSILNAVGSHDLVYLAGEAKSHCDLESMKQMVGYFAQTQPDVVRKHRFLMDAMSSVQHPTIDFESMANAEIAELQKQGAVLVTTSDPIG